MIDANGLVRRFGPLVAVDRVNLAVGAGEAVALFGPNGAGKSTLLRMLATLLQPDAGTLAWFGRSGHGGRRDARRRLGLLSHQSFLYPDLTPAQNLAFYARLYGVEDPQRRAAEWLRRVGVAGWGQRPLRTLSRGREQGCALARALIHGPEMILLDEPFTGLDRGGVDMLIDVLRDFVERGSSLILSTHDVELGLAVCQRAVVLRRGRKVWDGIVGGAARAEFDEAYARIFATAPGNSHA